MAGEAAGLRLPVRGTWLRCWSTPTPCSISCRCSGDSAERW